MEEEIDLREYIEVLIRRWKWIVGAALSAAVVALVVSFLLPPTYEATALVAVTKPRYMMRFDPRFETLDDIQPAYKAYPELAASDELLQELLASLDPLPEGVETLRDLRMKVEAKSGADPSIIRLIVRHRNPEEAARIANVWAELFVERANELYGGQGETEVEFFEAQLERAEAELEAAEQALIAFQARNRAAILQNQLASYKQMQADYLADQRTIAYITQDIEGLREQLAGQPGGQPVSLGDQLTALFLQIKAFNAQTSTPIYLQVDSAATLSEMSPSEQIAFLDSLVEVLEEKSAEIDNRLAELEPQILALQQQLEEVKAEEDRLRRARDLARETYMTLARKVEEARIAAEDVSGEVRLASQAAVPEKPTSPRKLLNTVVAGALGLMLGVFWAFAVEWWQQEGQGAKEGEEKG
ncbi:MAG TPA: hypothetical protein G4O00_06740 [Thermoflexia bacterium]|nr:hypothetical protein [Thermoflexia bacterium]